MSPAFVLLLVILATVAVSLLISLTIVRRTRARAARTLEPLGPPTRTTAATSLGRLSQGVTQLRGTGTLVLTPHEIAFAQWVPNRLVRIPRTDIVTTDTTRSHLGKRLKSDLLRVRWRAPDVADGEDTIAFFVRDLDTWLADLGGRRTE